MARLHQVHDELHEETYIVDDWGQECCEMCGVRLHGNDTDHEGWCDEYDEPTEEDE